MTGEVRSLKRISKLLAAVIILSVMIAPLVSASGAEPLDWDSYKKDPDYTIYAKGEWAASIDFNFDHDILYSEYIGDGREYTTLTAYKSGVSGPVAEQSFVVDAQFQLDSSIGLKERVRQYANRFNTEEDFYEAYITAEPDRFELHGRYYKNPGSLSWSTMFSMGAMIVCGDTYGSYEQFVKYAGLNEAEYNKRLSKDKWSLEETEIAGRTAFIWTYTQDNYNRYYYYHICDELPEMPGCWLRILADFTDTGPANYQVKEDDNSAELHSILNAYRDVRETILYDIIPEFASVQISATWFDGTSVPVPNVQSETHEAEEDPGEDEGTIIRPDVVEPPEPSMTTPTSDKTPTATKIALSVGGAIAAAGALGGGKNDGGRDEEEKKRKTYKMKVYKGFGNSIRRGAKPVTVWARIVEVVNGVEENRPDLSEKITVSGTGMNVESAGMHNSYKGASVTIPADSDADKATLTFTFAGEGGVFHNNVVFRVIGDPQITFPDVTEDGKRWDVNTRISRVDMIAGKGGKERLRFVITDTDVEPKAIRFRDHDGFNISYEKDTQWRFTYYANIENHTAPIEKRNGVFASERSVKVIVEAEFEDGLVAEGYFIIMLYPEGLSVSTSSQFMWNDRLVIKAVQLDNVSPGYEPFPTTVFFTTLAYLDNEGKAVTVDNPGFSYKDITDDGKYGDLFKYNFEYRINHRGTSGIAFHPDRALPSLGDPYEARFPISVEAENGARYRTDIPLAVFGEDPRPRYTDADRAYALKMLQKDIKLFGLGNNKEVNNMVRLAASGFASVKDINDARKAVIEYGTIFYQDYQAAYEKMNALYTEYIAVASTLVKCGDFAIEKALQIKFGGYGGLAAKIINPLKNLFATYAGEYIASGSIDKAPDFVETLLKGCEEALSTAITGAFLGSSDLSEDSAVTFALGKVTKTVKGNAMEEIKNVLGYVIAVYIMIRFVHHYNDGKPNEKGDIFRSMLAACADLGFEALKAFVLDRLAKAAGALTEKMIKWFGKVCQKLCQEKLLEAVMKAGDKAFEKGIKSGLKADGIITTATYRAAKTAKALAKRDAFVEGVKKFDYSAIAKKIGEGVETVGESKFYGTIINYLMTDGAESEKGYDITDTKTIVYNFTKKFLGLSPEKVYASGVLNPLDVTLRMENGKIIIGMLGCVVEILMTGENFVAMAEAAFESMFSWLDAVWEMMKNNPEVPDPRDYFEKNSEILRQQMNKQKQILENLEDVEFKRVS